MNNTVTLPLPPEDIIVKVEKITKTFENGMVTALKNANLKVKRGEFIAIMGPSGSGKSTLLHLIGAMEKPDSGKIIVDGFDLTELNDKNASRIRSEKIGFVFQLHNLIPTLSALENVQIPMFESSLSRKEKLKKALSLLELVGLSERRNFLPVKLSGGERQRVAIARALANDPAIVLADEPTGNLDTESSHVVIKLLGKIRKEKNTTVVLVTHDPDIAEHTDRVVNIRDGQIIEELEELEDKPEL